MSTTDVGKLNALGDAPVLAGIEGRRCAALQAPS
jgi:hypothetical protein